MTAEDLPKRLARWLVNLGALLIMGFMSLMGGCTEIQGIAQRSYHTVRQQIPITITGKGNLPKKEFVAQIEYILGRKGPYANLAIYRKTESNARIWSGTQADDPYTTPVKIRVDPGIDISNLRYRHFDDENAVRRITVSESEFGFSTTYLDPLELDQHYWFASDNETGDYEPEFILHQPDTINRRANPIGIGTYVLDYDIESDEWVLSRLSGWGAKMRVPWEREKAQAIILTVALLSNLLLASGGRFSLLTVAYASLVCGALLWFILPWIWFIGVTLGAAILFDLVARLSKDPDKG